MTEAMTMGGRIPGVPTGGAERLEVAPRFAWAEAVRLAAVTMIFLFHFMPWWVWDAGVADSGVRRFAIDDVPTRGETALAPTGALALRPNDLNVNGETPRPRDTSRGVA